MLNLFRLLGTLLTLLVNYLSTALPLNNMTTGQLSDQLHTLITPAGFTFAIWSVIYLGLAVVIFRLLSGRIQFSKKALQWYLLSCLANASWIVAWHYGNLHLAMVLIVILLVSLIALDQIIKHDHSNIRYYAWVRGVFLVYFGWVQIATLLMTTIYIQYALGWIDNQNIVRPITALIAAGVLNLIVLWKEHTNLTVLVYLWALFGIYSTQTNESILLTSIIVGGLSLCALIGSFFRGKPGLV